MQNDLINLSAIHAINTTSRHINDYIHQCDDTPTLRDLKLRQVKAAEIELVKNMNKLLDMYASIQVQAVHDSPDPELERMLYEVGVSTT